jgi:UrcA family protein
MKDCTKFAAAILFLSATSIAAFAAEEASENVTVFAPYVVKKVETGPMKERTTTVTVSREVSYKDLDLATAEGRAALESRVQQMAKDVCSELNRRYPSNVYVPVSSNKNCVKDAINEAMIQVRGVESTAKKIG